LAYSQKDAFIVKYDVDDYNLTFFQEILENLDPAFKELGIQKRKKEQRPGMNQFNNPDKKTKI
jgi:hypothetical protein